MATKPKITLGAIRAWRKKERLANRPSGLLDFYRVHDVCPWCKGKKADCSRCSGTGRFCSDPTQ